MVVSNILSGFERNLPKGLPRFTQGDDSANSDSVLVYAESDPDDDGALEIISIKEDEPSEEYPEEIEEVPMVQIAPDQEVSICTKAQEASLGDVSKGLVLTSSAEDKVVETSGVFEEMQMPERTPSQNPRQRQVTKF